MTLQNFDNLKEVLDRSYGGATGSKIAVEYNNTVWMLKRQQSLKQRNLNNVEISYANDVVSEYIGSHIYEIFGMPVHETILGEYFGEHCVICSDKTYPKKLYEFKEFRNRLMDRNIIQQSSGMSTNISDIIEVINNTKYIDKEKVLQRFWDMFCIDTLIGNTDRNNGNWGFLFDKDSSMFYLYDVYDCGGCLNNKRSDNQMSDDLKNSNEIYHLAINYTFNYKVNHKRINPFKYLRSNLSNKYICNSLQMVIEDRLNLILDLVESVKPIISDIRCDWYCKILIIRFNELLKIKSSIDSGSALERMVNMAKQRRV